jgi:4-amino-4-deoxy-L-arabinose transferase-like glycosyltransferase
MTTSLRSGRGPDADAARPRARVDLRTRVFATLIDHGELVAIGVVAFVVYAWSLDSNGIGNAYYAGAVRSMTESFKNFYYASFDPGGWVTVDKPPLPYWPEAALAKVFGIHSWTLFGPNVVFGSLSAVLTAATVRRVWGRRAGVAAGALLVVTPTTFAMSRSNMPDQTMVFFVCLAAYAVTRAIPAERARKWMVLAGVALGAAFLSKMLAGLMVAPALWLAYLVCGRGRLQTRALAAGAGALALAAVCGAWVLSVDAVPVGDRPWIGGSKDGTALDLTLGYNGFGRIFGQGGPGGGRPGQIPADVLAEFEAQVPGGAPANGTDAPSGFDPRGRGGPGGFGGSAFGTGGGVSGIWHLVDRGIGEQFLWLGIPAAAGLVGGLYVAVRRRRRDERLGSVILFGGWTLTTMAVLGSAEGISHPYYVSAVAPGLAGLCGIGLALLRPGKRTAAVAAGVLVVSAAAQAKLWERTSRLDLVPWVVAVGTLAVCAVLLRAAWRRPGRHLPLPASLAVVALVGLAPTVWVGASYGNAANGTFPEARPDGGGGFGGPGGFGGRGGPGGLEGGGYTTEQLAWLKLQSGPKATWILAVPSAGMVGAVQAEGWSILAYGGFTGSDPAMTPAKLADLVEAGKLRFVGVGGFPGGFGGRGQGGTGDLPAGLPAGGPGDLPAGPPTGGFPGGFPAGESGPGGGRGFGGFGGANSAVQSAVEAACKQESLPGGTSATVYDCAGRADQLRAAADKSSVSPPAG